MIDLTRQGIHNKITQVVPENTVFVVYYENSFIIGGGLENTGWDKLRHGIVKLEYNLSTRQVIKIPRYKAYLHLVEASVSIDKQGLSDTRNFHYVFIKGLADNHVYVHKICLRTNPITGESIGDVSLYTEKIPNKIDKKIWKYSIY